MTPAISKLKVDYYKELSRTFQTQVELTGRFQSTDLDQSGKVVMALVWSGGRVMPADLAGPPPLKYILVYKLRPRPAL